MKKILVAGGAGFIGSHLCKYLLDRGNMVYCLDNLLTGREENISELRNNINFSFIEWDIQKFIDIEVDEIYNCACPASPDWYQKSPTNTIRTCILGTINLLDLAKKYNAKIMQFSTSEVYGEPLCDEQNESYWGNVNPIGIRSCYDEGKRCAESLFFSYQREFNVRIKIIRIFNTYGENMNVNDGRVVSNFIWQAIHNEDITVNGDGSQTRSFCYVSDLVTAIVKVMEDTSDDFYGPINLGNPTEVSVLDLAKLIIEKTKSQSKIIFRELPKDDPTHRRPDITLAKTLLKWRPKVTLDKGLNKTIKYFEFLN